MEKKFYLPGTKGLRINYSGQTYVLAEDIHYEINYSPYHDTDTDRPVELHAAVITDDPDITMEIWWKPEYAEDIDAWTDYSHHIAGLVTTGDD